MKEEAKTKQRGCLKFISGGQSNSLNMTFGLVKSKKLLSIKENAFETDDPTSRTTHID
jgi:hypothetical protein